MWYCRYMILLNDQDTSRDSVSNTDNDDKWWLWCKFFTTLKIKCVRTRWKRKLNVRFLERIDLSSSHLQRFTLISHTVTRPSLVFRYSSKDIFQQMGQKRCASCSQIHSEHVHRYKRAGKNEKQLGVEVHKIFFKLD